MSSSLTERTIAEMRAGGKASGTLPEQIEARIETVRHQHHLNDLRRGLITRTGDRRINLEFWPMPERAKFGILVTVGDIKFYEDQEGFPSDTLKAKLLLLAP